MNEYLAAIRDPYRLESSGRDWWAVDCSFVPKGWKALHATGWLRPHEVEQIVEWCKKNVTSDFDVYAGQTLFDSYDDATLFYMTFVQ